MRATPKGVAPATLAPLTRLQAALALAAALVFVKLLTSGSEADNCVQIIGLSFANAIGSAWKPFAFLLGALGSFFSGSATVSNLTFGAVQQAIAEAHQLDVTAVLALQGAGAAFGNMVCIHNIVAIAAVIDFPNKESAILKRTIVPLLAAYLLSVVMSFLV